MRASLILAAAAALVAGSALAGELVARNGKDEVRLSDAPCAVPQVLPLIPPQAQGEFRAARATIDGQSYLACWRPYGEGVHLIYEDGDQGMVPLRDLKPAPSV